MVGVEEMPALLHNIAQDVSMYNAGEEDRRSLNSRQFNHEPSPEN